MYFLSLPSPSLFIFTCFNVSFVAFALSKLKIEADLEIWFIGRVRKLVLNINSSWHWVIWKKKKCVLVKTCLFKNDTFKQSKWYDEVRGGRNREEFQFYLWRRRVFEVDIVEKRIKGNGQISRRIIFYFFYRIDTGCLSSTTANIDKRQSYIQRKMFLVESGKINVSQRSYLGYSFVAMRWLISSFENCELKRLLKFENEVLQNEIQCIWYIYIYNGIGNVKQFERVSVCFSKKKKKKSIARLKKARETFFE